jgi:hypothetical protein
MDQDVDLLAQRVEKQRAKLDEVVTLRARWWGADATTGDRRRPARREPDRPG